MSTSGKMTEKLFYGRGKTPFYACQADQRFSFCMYVPTSWDGTATEPYPVAVLVHGTNRNAEGYRDLYAAFAEEHNCVVVAPLFPAGITAPWELNSYKWLAVEGIRFDQILLSMLDEIASVFPIDTSKFLLHGFSGGGHFAHRFFYVHPERLRGVSIGAPGVVSLLDFDYDWWVGVRNFADIFGKAINLDAMRQVPVQMAVGGDDTETWEITIEPGSRLWMDGANSAGVNRQDRMRSLKASFNNHGIDVRHDVLPGIRHEGAKMYPAVTDFFGQVLQRDRSLQASAAR